MQFLAMLISVPVLTFALAAGAWLCVNLGPGGLILAVAALYVYKQQVR